MTPTTVPFAVFVVIITLLRILIFSFVSIGMGFLAALALRERYYQLYPEEATEEADASEEIVSEAAPEAAPEPGTVPEGTKTEEPIPETSAGDEAESEKDVSPALAEQHTDNFDDLGLLPKSFKVDSILDDMLGENVSETPEDLSARLDQEETAFQADYSDAFQDTDEDMLARALENAASTNGAIDFNDENFLDRVAEETHTHREIAPMAVELLGEDFNFDALLTGEPPEPPEIVEASAPAFREWEDGTFQTESECYTDAPALLDLLPGEQDIVSFFPDEWVRNEVIEPDRSEEAEKWSFVEESRPMFVRKKKKTP